MLISTIRLSNKGLKAYHEADKSDEEISDFEGFHFGPASIKKTTSEFEGGSRRRDREMDGEYKRGGRSNQNSGAERKQSCLDKILSLGSNDKGGSRSQGERTNFSQMTKEEKAERIQ